MAGRTRNIQVIFRVDEQERGLIRQKMELMGVRNMQAYPVSYTHLTLPTIRLV